MRRAHNSSCQNIHNVNLIGDMELDDLDGRSLLVPLLVGRETSAMSAQGALCACASCD